MRRLAPEETNEFCFHRGKGSLANGDYERYESSPPAFFFQKSQQETTPTGRLNKGGVPSHYVLTD